MKYRSDLLRTSHELAAANFAIGAISEAEMREFDELCLVPEGNPRTESTHTFGLSPAARQQVQEDQTAHEADKSTTIEHIRA